MTNDEAVERVKADIAETCPEGSKWSCALVDKRTLRLLLSRYERMEKENAQLRADLLDAAEEVEAWGAYAGEYFQTKHDLAGEVARIRRQALGASE